MLAAMRESGACDDERVRETVLVVDDHQAFRASTRALLDSAGFDVVGEAATGTDAVLQANRLRPDLVLLDIRLPDIDGFEVARQLSDLADPPDVVLVSSRDAITYGSRLADAPARGFLPKSEISGAALRRLLT
jgi:DNA-binding NarL/FixJ family response regulator